MATASNGLESKESTRSVMKSHLSMGLVGCPIALYTAARAERVAFHQLCPSCHGRMNQQLSCPTHGIVPKNTLLKGHELNKNQMVIVDGKELDALESTSTKVIEIAEFVDASEVDPLHFENSYYVVPQVGGLRTFGIIRAGLVKTKKWGVGRITMYGREQVVLIRPYGSKQMVMHTLFYSHEVRGCNFPDLAEPLEAEVKFAVQLIKALSDSFDMTKYSDSYTESVLQLIKSKVGEATEPQPKTSDAPVPKEDNILASLEAALKDAENKRKQKKPAVVKEEEAVA